MYPTFPANDAEFEYRRDRLTKGIARSHGRRWRTRRQRPDSDSS